jgi:dihydroorotase
MAAHFDLIVRDGIVATPGGFARIDIGVRGGRIAALGRLVSADAEAEESLECPGLHVLPGVIDSQVHFREPGLEHKEDLATGTEGAVAGGVTAVFEMPNTKPATTTAALLRDKLERAAGRAWCDYAFFVGASARNAEELGELERLPGCSGVKMFMGSSTGDLLVPDDATVARVLANGNRRVAVHAEDELRLAGRKTLATAGDVSRHPVWRDAETAITATTRLLRLAREARRRVHVLHITTGAEMLMLARYRDIATVEVTPNHLTLFAPDCYERLGTLAQMNPPVRDETERRALWWAVTDGTVDVIGSDHAPHTLEEKGAVYPMTPSGMTGVQTLVPIMLDHVRAGRLSLDRFIDLTSAGPARVFGIAGKGRIAAGYDADFTIVDLSAQRTIQNSWIRSRAGWSPFDGMTVTGWPVATVIRGRPVMREGELIGPPAGRPVRFSECLPV